MDFGSLFGLDLIEWLRRMYCLLGTDHHQTNKDKFPGSYFWTIWVSSSEFFGVFFNIYKNIRT